jgi:2-oxoglutarate dehydrogenase E1 component
VTSASRRPSRALRDYQEQLERVFAETRDATSQPAEPTDVTAGLDLPLAQQEEDATAPAHRPTAVDLAVLKRIGDSHVSPPEGFTVHPKLQPLLERRAAMVTEGGIDWGFGELLAFGSLLMEGTPVRLAGQDSRRGTFVQRHAVLTDKVTGAEWTPLAKPHRGAGEVLDLRFAAVRVRRDGLRVRLLGRAPRRARALGGAVRRLRQRRAGHHGTSFISSGEQKWGQRSSVVLLLPHGFEGQGPDHSSGRIERFL